MTYALVWAISELIWHDPIVQPRLRCMGVCSEITDENPAFTKVQYTRVRQRPESVPQLSGIGQLSKACPKKSPESAKRNCQTANSLNKTYKVHLKFFLREALLMFGFGCTVGNKGGTVEIG